MGKPDGGWFDEKPPQVIGAFPADKATDINTQKIRILFDEFIKIENASENVVISPPQIESPEIRASGKRIEIELNDSLKPNTTYTFDFSDAITDNNEGNPMGNFTYSFSTGAEIDTMEVSGYVLDAQSLEPVKSILVGLYDNPEDSLFRTMPLQRVSRTDSRGHFVIKGIAPGSYRIFALQDADGDYLFSQKSEMIAFNHDVIVPSSKPDMRQDTIWRDSLHIDRLESVPYTHFLPDDIVLRAFTETQTDRILLKAERMQANNFSFFFTYGHEELPIIKGLNFDEQDAFVVDATERRDTITYWLRDTTLVNQDTLLMQMSYQMTDTLGNLVLQTDTLEILSKEPYAKRMKQQQKAFEDWKKQQDKAKKRGERYDSIMPVDPMNLKLGAPSQLDPDRNILFESTVPIVRADTSMIHLYVKRDSLWYQARYELRKLTELKYMLLGEWRPKQEYSLELDSAAFCDLYGKANKAQKVGFGVRSNDSYSTVLFTLTGLQDQPVVAQLLNAKDAVVKETRTTNGNAEFFYVTPGTYYLRIFIDRNGNGIWDTGNYELDEQPEEVFYYHEAIECKEKWDVTQTWNPKQRSLEQQKPGEIVKQKADKKKTVKSRNTERAKKLGIKYEADLSS